MKARILVIEDEMAINDLLCMNLEAAGYETVGYLDGNDASEGVAQDMNFSAHLWILCFRERMVIPCCRN